MQESDLPRNLASIARLTSAPLFALAGLVHVANPDVSLPMVPTVVPVPTLIIRLTGLTEIAAAVGLFIPRTRASAGIMLAIYSVCIFPVNINHAVHDLSTGTGLGWAYRCPRLFMQPIICWALVAGELSGKKFAARNH